MPGPLPKHPDRRHRRNVRDVRVLPLEVSQAAPPAPTGLLKSTIARWEAYWRSPVAAAADPVTDLPLIERYFRALDELERCGRVFRKARVTAGSQGQIVLHPLARYLSQLSSELMALEDRLGLSPKSRAQLGMAIAEAQKTLGDLAAIGYDDE
jgi:P27 family predicted phage terminase small subunit